MCLFYIPENTEYKMYNPVKIKIIPLNFINIFVYFASAPIFLIVEVNSAKNIIIMHCPSAKQNNSESENKKFDDIAAKASILASMGDEHGLEAKANTAPTKNGKINMLPLLFSGIFFMNDGNCISKNPIRFKPKTMINEEKINKSTGVAKPVNALPVSAHNTPIMLNTADNPIEKESI